MEKISDFPVWRELAVARIDAIARDLNDKYSTSYYVPERSGSPYRSVRIATDVAAEIFGMPELRSAADWKNIVFTEFERQRERFQESDFADPDGYVCSTLRSFISVLKSLD